MIDYIQNTYRMIYKSDIYKTAQHLQQAVFQKVIFCLDQNSTHKIRMKYNLALLSNITYCHRI